MDVEPKANRRCWPMRWLKTVRGAWVQLVEHGRHGPGRAARPPGRSPLTVCWAPAAARRRASSAAGRWRSGHAPASRPATAPAPDATASPARRGRSAPAWSASWPGPAASPTRRRWRSGGSWNRWRTSGPRRHPRSGTPPTGDENDRAGATRSVTPPARAGGRCPATDGQGALVELAVEGGVLHPVRMIESERHLHQPAARVGRQAVEVLGVRGLLLRRPPKCGDSALRRASGRPRRVRSSSTTPCTGTWHPNQTAAPWHPPGNSPSTLANHVAAVPTGPRACPPPRHRASR